MSKREIVENNAYMVLADLAYSFDTSGLVVTNLKNLHQIAKFNLYDNRFLLKETNMSEVNKYKSIAIIERNKDFLLDGYKKWEGLCDKSKMLEG